MEFNFCSPYKSYSNKLVLLGGGELGKQLIISAQNLGIETYVISRYENSPASQISHFSYVIDMMNKECLIQIILKINPNYIVPEIEAIATNVLDEAEKKNITVIPNAKAVNISMNREKIRKLATQLGVNTSKYEFVSLILISESLNVINSLVIKL